MKSWTLLLLMNPLRPGHKARGEKGFIFIIDIQNVVILIPVGLLFFPSEKRFEDHAQSDDDEQDGEDGYIDSEYLTHTGS